MTISTVLRRQVYQRANGCCEYCLLSEILSFASHEVDHIIAQKHGGVTTLDNLALACILCNKHKGSDLVSIDPLTHEIARLFNPRTQRWADHFRLESGLIVPLSSAGHVTVFLLQLNRADRVSERSFI